MPHTRKENANAFTDFATCLTDSLNTLAGVFMTKTGLTSEDCQQTFLINRLNDIHHVINGIEPSDMKPHLESTLTDNERDNRVTPFDATLALDELNALSELIDAWKLRISEISPEPVVFRDRFIESGDDLIGIFRFHKPVGLTDEEMVAEINAGLYDDIGSSGHFRLLPTQKEALTSDFIMGVYPNGEQAEFLTSTEDGTYIAFLKYDEGNGTSLDEEIEIFNQETIEFALSYGYTITQVDIDDVYQ